MLTGHLINLVGYFDYYQILELFLPCGKKKSQHDTSLRNLGLINGQRAVELRRKGCVFLKGLSETEHLRLIREPHHLNCFSTPKWELLYIIVVELSTQSRVPASIRTGSDSSPTCRNVSLRQLRGRIGKSPCCFLFRAPPLIIGKVVRKAAQRAKSSQST